MVHTNIPVAIALSLSLVPIAQAQQVNFSLPQSVAQGTNVRIDGSGSMAPVNQLLKQQFEQKYPGTKIDLASNGTPQGLQALLDGKVDVAAIGRPLNEKEKAKGLVAVPIGWDKIAIVVGKDNPFAKSLNINQFARIFRGEVTNWSQVGGPSAPIRFIDRPDNSDTRAAFRSYPVFKQGEFKTGGTATILPQDTSAAVAQKLGNDGIGYTTANQLKGLTNVKPVAMHGTQPTDARYPFSQSLYYVYRADQASSPAVKSFLGFAGATETQQALEKAGVMNTIATAAKGAQVSRGSGDKAAPFNAGAPANPDQSSGESGGLLGLLPSLEGGGAGTGTASGPNWWWLFPIASGAALAWLLGRSRKRAKVTPVAPAATTGNFVPPVAGDRDFSTRIQSDRRTVAQFEAPEVDVPNIDVPNIDVPDIEAPDLTPDVDLPNGRLGNFGTAMGNGVQNTVNFAGDAAAAGGNLFNNTGAVVAGSAAAAAGAGAMAWAALSGKKQPRVVLKARSPQEAEAFWDIPGEVRDAVRQQGGEKLALRLYDVTDIDLDNQPAHSVQQFECDELTHRQRLPIGLSNRDYLAELGYLTPAGQWLSLGRSAHVRVPPASNLSGSEVSRPFLDQDRDPAAEWFEDTPDEDNFLDRMGRKVSDTASGVTQSSGAALAGGAAAATGAGAAAWRFLSRNGNDAPAAEAPVPVSSDRPVSDGWQSNDLPSADLEGRIVLTPRNGQWAYAYWDVPRSQRAVMEHRADQNLMLRLYDVTDRTVLPDQYEQFDVDDLALSCDVPIAHSNRSYVVELGYADPQSHWTPLARSSSVWMPA
jgi:phosphate transport system substrate-binding protein